MVKVLLGKRDGYATVTPDFPEHMNAMPREPGPDFVAEFDEIRTDSDIRVPIPSENARVADTHAGRHLGPGLWLGRSCGGAG